MQSEADVLELESEGVFIDRKKARFSGADWHTKQPLNLFVLGCGNIGSWLALDLARKGHKIHLFDMDKIEEENLGCQFYSMRDIGSSKVQTTASLCNLFSGNSTLYVYSEYNKESMTNPIVFCCVDSMKTRKLAFKKWKEQENRELFIDTRNAIEITEVYCVQKGMEEKYEKTLYSDKEANDLPCNLKSSMHCCLIGVGLISSCFCNYISNKNLNMNLRDIPFYQSFEIPFLRYEIQNLQN